VPYGEVDCPYPLKYNYDGESTFAESGYDGAQMCVMPCPSPMWSDEEWTAGVTLTLVVNGTSGLLSLFIVQPISICSLLPLHRGANKMSCLGGEHVHDARQTTVPWQFVYLYCALDSRTDLE
jgi:hypothetical protein